MDAITALLLSEVACRKMLAVRSGSLDHSQGKDSLIRWMDCQTRTELIEYFTREYSREKVGAFQFFRLL